MRSLKVLKKQRSGRPRRFALQHIENYLEAVPMLQRSTIRSASHAIGVPKYTFFDLLKRRDVCRHSSSVKQKLTKQKMILCVRFALQFVDRRFSTLPYVLMYNHVYIDEKWFYITRVNQTVYITKTRSC